jgi:hypothetical protein
MQLMKKVQMIKAGADHRLKEEEEEKGDGWKAGQGTRGLVVNCCLYYNLEELRRGKSENSGKKGMFVYAHQTE